MPKRILTDKLEFRFAKSKYPPTQMVAILLPWQDENSYYMDEEPRRYTGTNLDEAWVCPLQFGIDKRWSDEVVCVIFTEEVQETPVEQPLEKKLASILDESGSKIDYFEDGFLEKMSKNAVQFKPGEITWSSAVFLCLSSNDIARFALDSIDRGRLTEIATKAAARLNLLAGDTESNKKVLSIINQSEKLF